MMQVSLTKALDILRGLPQQPGTTASGASSDDPRLKLLQRANEALDDLQQSTKSSADIAKERAARKLAELQQQLDMLKSGGMSPEAVAHLAAELSQKIAAAAAQFASALSMAGTPATAGAQASTADAGTASAAKPASTDAKAVETSAESATKKDEPVDTAQARKAYQETLADGEGQASGISSEDREILEKLKSLLRDVRQVLDRSMRDIRNGKHSQDHAAPAMPLPMASAGSPSSIII
jgi:hypothetical protein